MKKQYIRLFPFLLFTLLPFSPFPFSPFTPSLSAQSLPVGFLGLEDTYRKGQLMGTKDSQVSFAVRPVYPVQAFGVRNTYDPDGTLDDERWAAVDGIYRLGWDGYAGRGMAMSLQILPLERITQYTSHHPYSLNDGAMIPAVGFQTMTRGGVYGEVGYFWRLGKGEGENGKGENGKGENGKGEKEKGEKSYILLFHWWLQFLSNLGKN